MIRPPPISTRTDTPLPYTTLCRSAAVPDRQHGIDPITDREARGPGSALSHDAGDLSPGRHRKLIGGDKTSVANLVVHRIDPGRLDSNQPIAAARLRSRNLVNAKHLGAAECLKPDSPHVTLPESTPPRRVAWRRQRLNVRND